MPPNREKPNKRKSLSFAKKRELCEWKRDNPSYNQEELAEKFDISKPQDFKNQKRDRDAKFPEVESALYLWMQ
ncbi:4275_t:CDS:2 [Funneliformis mosseae]|uniref:4275_t:CDS:1 n=1 Tax=Funneliformis mosseae TaxID=27381 RepID=A0A9N9I2Q5_FUNMO|nr:4275_t:CDS:2 [Funneliformis mosseae]